MKVVFLCAGKWTRMLPFAKIIPKEMLPLGDKPLLHHTVGSFRQNGFNDFIFVLWNDKDIIKKYFTYQENTYSNTWIEDLNNIINWSNISFVNDVYRWTWGSLMCARDLIDDDYFFVVFGDIYISADNIEEIIKLHNSSKWSVVLVTEVSKKYREKYKEAVIGDDSKVISLLSVPDKESNDGMSMVWWIFILHKDVFNKINDIIEVGNFEKEFGLIRPIENMIWEYDTYWYRSESWIYDIWNIDERKKAFINI